MEYLAKGKRGIVHLVRRDGRKVVVKTKNPTSAADTLANEASFLKILNKHGIGPKMLEYKDNSLVMEYVEGTPILDYLQKESREAKKSIIKLVLEQLRKMDKLRINKYEMTRPDKHIIVKNNKPVMIDFERARYVDRPKNVTQFLQFITSKRLAVSMADVVKAPKDEVMRLSGKYKERRSEKAYRLILSIFERKA